MQVVIEKRQWSDLSHKHSFLLKERKTFFYVAIITEFIENTFATLSVVSNHQQLQ